MSALPARRWFGPVPLQAALHAVLHQCSTAVQLTGFEGSGFAHALHPDCTAWTADVLYLALLVLLVLLALLVLLVLLALPI